MVKQTAVCSSCLKSACSFCWQ